MNSLTKHDCKQGSFYLAWTCRRCMIIAVIDMANFIQKSHSLVLEYNGHMLKFLSTTVMASAYPHLSLLKETDATVIVGVDHAPKDWKRLHVRPRSTWLQTVEQDLRSNHLTLRTTLQQAQDIVQWRVVMKTATSRERFST